MKEFPGMSEDRRSHRLVKTIFILRYLESEQYRRQLNRQLNKGEFYYAEVKGDQILHDEKVVSPGEFARNVANSSRNAWRDLQIRRPDDEEWYLAETLRKRVLAEYLRTAEEISADTRSEEETP